jgi:CelD/BcsL family acetyltransferase involved in cellulose biosynthesis
MECRRVGDEAGLAEIREGWNALWKLSRSPILPLTWSWFDAWWRSFANELGPSAELNVLAYHSAGELRAIVPLFRRQTRFRGIPVRELTSLANGYSPLWDMIVAANVAEEEMDAIGCELLREPEIDVLALRRLAGDSPLRRWISEHPEACGPWGDRDSFRTPVVDTTGTWEEYFGSRPRKYRNKLKKKLRDFENREGAAISFVPLDCGDHPALGEVVEVSKRSWKRNIGTDLGSRPSEREFLQRLIDHIGPTSDAGVWFARLEDRPIAYELHVKSNGITYPIRADIDDAARRLSPGSVVEHYALRAAFDDPEIHTYDTCADNYWYLRKLTEDERMVHVMEVFPRRAKGSALYLLEYRAMPVLRSVRKRFQKAEKPQ